MKTVEHSRSRGGFPLLVLLFALVQLPWTSAQAQMGYPCRICGKALYGAGAAYYSHDKVTDEKVYFCGNCAELQHHCFACGLPVLPGGRVLQDGRHYCPRDGDLAITEAGQMVAVVNDTLQKLDHGLRHYMQFPTDNLQIDMIDRINLEEMVAKAGNDYRCPDLRGYYETITTPDGGRLHSIHLMSGHDHASTRNTLAHELTHAWIADNIPPDRNLDRLANEGFCELIAYVLAEKAGDTNAIYEIEQNAYTRGQFALFKEAKSRFELQVILDWMRYGNEPLIDGTDLPHIRQVSKPRKETPQLWLSYAGTAAVSTNPVAAKSSAPPTAPDQLQLKGILGNGERRMAMISGKSVMADETFKVRLGEELVEIHCLEIGSDFVRVKFTESGDEETLKLPPPN